MTTAVVNSFKAVGRDEAELREREKERKKKTSSSGEIKHHSTGLINANPQPHINSQLYRPLIVGGAGEFGERTPHYKAIVLGATRAQIFSALACRSIMTLEKAVGC